MSNVNRVIKDSQNKLVEPYLVKKSNRVFIKGSSYSSVVNHLRYIYSSMEEAFLQENQCFPVICSECDTRTAKFLSFYDGYSDICKSKTCYSEKQKRVNKLIAKNRVKVGYDSYLANNIPEIKDLVFNNMPFVDTFLNKTHTNLREMKKGSESSMLDDSFKEMKVCSICKSTFSDYFYSSKNTCSKKCSRQKAGIYANEAKKRIYAINAEKQTTADKSFILFMESINNLEFSKQCHNGEIINFPKSLKDSYPYRYIIFKSFTNNNDSSFYDKRLELYCSTHVFNRGNLRRNYTAYLLNYKNLLSECELSKFFDTLHCSVCDTPVNKFNNFLLTDTYEYVSPHVSKYCYCSERCYLNALKQNKHELYPITDEYKINHSLNTTKRIQSGKFTPKSNNRLTHWFKRDGINWRSSWEYAFYIHNIFNGLTLYFEKIRIPYVYLDKNKIYIVDFVDYDNKILYEIGPSSVKSDEKELAKQHAALNWCEKNGFIYKMIDETFFENLSFNDKCRILNHVNDDDSLSKKLKKVLKCYE